MQITITMRNPKAGDARSTVTLREAGTPWPIKFHFLAVPDPKTPGESELVNVGFEIGEEWTPYMGDPDSASAPALETPEPLDTITIQRIVANYGLYLQTARNTLIVSEPEGLANAIRRLRGAGKKPARLTDDFYRLIAAEYDAQREAGLSPGKELAAKYQIHPSAVSRWISEARRRGYIDAKKETSP